MKKGRKLIIILSIILFVLIGIVISLLFNKEDDTRSDYFTEEVFEIETKYGELYYPVKWEETTRIEIKDKEIYSIEFYGNIEGKTEQYLFGIEIGETQGDIIGVYKDEGQELSVGLVFKDLQFDETWTEEEKNIIYTMQEDVNYILDNLKKESKYTIL